jgi:DNA-binding MarR family transcriptional regulator
MAPTRADHHADTRDAPVPASATAELASAVIRAERMVATRLAAILGKDCSVDAWHALQLLSDGRGHAMSELIAHTLMPSSTVTRLVDGLIGDALAYRHVDDRDRRRVLVYATERGAELHAQLAARIEERREDLLGTDTPDRVLATLAELMRGLASDAPDRVLATLAELMRGLVSEPATPSSRP